MMTREKTIQGQEISEKQVDAWVTEAEQGYDVEGLRSRGRIGRGAVPSVVVPVRFTDAELAAVIAKAKRQNMNRSEAIRAAVAAWALL
jgi:hypothetical protein